MQGPGQDCPHQDAMAGAALILELRSNPAKTTITLSSRWCHRLFVFERKNSTVFCRRFLYTRRLKDTIATNAQAVTALSLLTPCL
jgi:hypothetical protein